MATYNGVWKALGSIAVAATIVGIHGTAYAADECDVSPDIAVAQCLNKRIKSLNITVDQLYNSALANMPVTDELDTRKSKAQLVKAQDAWKTYVQENCAYVGGLEGGGNLWATIFSEQCLRDEYRRRIDFFAHPPSNG